MTQRVPLIVSIAIVLVTAFGFAVFYAFNPSAREAAPVVSVNLVDNKDDEPPFIPNQNLDSELIGVRALKFLFFGDLMLDRHVGEKLAGQKIDYLFNSLAGENKEFFSGFDIVGANLEGAVTNDGAHYVPQNAYDFAFSPARIAELQDYGFNYFTLANNHFTDQGVKGVNETRQNLTTLGFNFSGAPDAQVDEQSVRVIEISGQKVALVGLSMVYANFDLVKATDLVSSAAEANDLVIVNIHWGTEYEHQFSQHQRNIGRALIDAGTDVIIGHHPHVVQGMEVYQKKPIFYSLGNFVFDQYFSPDTQEGLAVSLEVSSGTTTVQFIPLRSEKSIPRRMTENEQLDFFKKFTSWSDLDAASQLAVTSGRLEFPH